MRRAISLQTAQKQYLHRYTMEHVPEWARKPVNGRHYAPQYATDQEWYEKTKFPGEFGIPKSDTQCRSSKPSWPKGEWLASPPPPYPAQHLWDRISSANHPAIA